MRRFITSLPGRAVGHVTALALVLPYLTFIVAGRAEAQLTQLPSWAVLEFENKSSKGGASFGKTAAEAIQNELGKSGRVDPIPAETLQRAMADLGQVPPLSRKVDQLRLATEVRASSVVTGTIVEWRVNTTGGGKFAEVTIQVVVTDVASGFPVNGALVKGQSTTRAGDVSDETLVNEAINAAANAAIQDINSRTLPQATVLNTYVDEALVNQGTRAGFKAGQEVVILRGRQQVATGSIIDIDPDSARVRVTNASLGVQPGDKIRAVFPVPQPDWKNPLGSAGAENPPQRKQSRRTGGGSGVASLAVLLALGVALFGGGRVSNNNLAQDVIAEATLYPNESGEPAVRISWTPDLFVKGANQRVQWQIWRSDVLDAPVLISDGAGTSAIDTTQARTGSWKSGPITGTECNGTGADTDFSAVGVTPGRPYQYQVQLLYKVNSLDLPGNSTSGGGSGTASGLTTGGTATAPGPGTGSTGTGATTGTGTTTKTGTTTATTTGTTTGGTTGTAGSDCFFVSTKSAAKGLATPYNRPTLVSPAVNAVLTAPTPFSFQSVVNPSFPTVVEYVVEISPQPTFPRGQIRVVGKIQRNETGTLSTPIVDTSTMFPGAPELWWRVGVRNVADRPGPVPDANGERYIFSAPRRFTRVGGTTGGTGGGSTGGPPPPP